MVQKTRNDPCQSSSRSPAVERNRYFTGKYMTARDFAGEQHYFLSRHHLHNRLLHGSGVVCGLRVIHYPDWGDAECKEAWLVVKAGVAIDCYGRELLVREDTPCKVPLEEMPYKPDQNGSQEPQGRQVNGLLLCLRYDQEEIEKVPALYAEGQCDSTHLEANRIREKVEFEFRRLDEVKPGCWRTSSEHWDDPDAPCHNDCDEPLPGPSGVCLEPDCPCDGCVPLALISSTGSEEQGSHLFEIDMAGRTHLPTPARYLTHIVDINWPHGGEISLSTLRDEMKGKLTIRFDRNISFPEGDETGTGINSRTFIVQYTGVQQTLEFLPSVEDPRLDTTGDDADDTGKRTAVFTIDPDYLPVEDRDKGKPPKEKGRGSRHSIAGTDVYVTLLCDFILDCHDLPVDGNHLSGRRPTGNGTPGGVFLSWFHVSHDYDHQYVVSEEESKS